MGRLDFDLHSDILAKMKYFQYRTIASHMFDWTNLPVGIEGERLELMLIDRGSVSFFDTPVGQYILPYTSSGYLNVYGDLTDVHPLPINGDAIVAFDTVPRILYDNSLRQTFDVYLRTFSERLAYIQKSILITERNSRIPFVAKVNEMNKDSFARMQTKIDEGDPVFFVDENTKLEDIQLMPSGFVPGLFTELWNDYNKVEGEIYSLLGTMFNVEQNKQAGVGAAETIINYAQTFAFANSRLKQRQRWCEKVNQEFNLGIWCEKTNDIEEIMNQMMQSNARDPANIPERAEQVKAEEVPAANGQ